jgi:hypothetical protein
MGSKLWTNPGLLGRNLEDDTLDRMISAGCTPSLKYTQDTLNSRTEANRKV